ncbi:MAG TPA: hypothetical protein VMH83_06325, partial [Candidatus Acidoferrum sp.]|nr:hypothetical protein [Candidatus Acidoferrum sp.]
MKLPTRMLAASLLISLALTTKAQVPCPPEASLDKLLAFGSLFLGELHGTTETPQLVRCLVDRALVTSQQKLIVSLELEGDVRDPDSYSWQPG